MGAKEEVGRGGREEASGQPKEKRRKVLPEEGDARSRSLASGAQEAREQTKTRQQWGEKEVPLGGDGKSRSRTAGGDASARRKASDEGTTAQRLVTSDQGASSTSQGRGHGQRTDASEIKMEMDINMQLKDGRCATTKYRVGCLTPMQSVIKKVGKLPVVTFVLVFLVLVA